MTRRHMVYFFGEDLLLNNFQKQPSQTITKERIKNNKSYQKRTLKMTQYLFMKVAMKFPIDNLVEKWHNHVSFEPRIFNLNPITSSSLQISSTMVVQRFIINMSSIYHLSSSIHPLDQIFIHIFFHHNSSICSSQTPKPSIFHPIFLSNLSTN